MEKTSSAIFLSADNLIIEKAIKFFNENHLWKELANIIEGKNKLLPLSKIELFVMKYSNEKKIIYKTLRNGKQYNFNVNEEYQKEVAHYSKRLMEPFKRDHSRLIRFIHDDLILTTTVGQLNYMRWAFENGVIYYILKHPDMNLKRKPTIKANLSQ
jgi:hypothetical protein